MLAIEVKEGMFLKTLTESKIEIIRLNMPGPYPILFFDHMTCEAGTTTLEILKIFAVSEWVDEPKKIIFIAEVLNGKHIMASLQASVEIEKLKGKVKVTIEEMK